MNIFNNKETITMFCRHSFNLLARWIWWKIWINSHLLSAHMKKSLLTWKLNHFGSSFCVFCIKCDAIHQLNFLRHIICIEPFDNASRDNLQVTCHCIIMPSYLYLEGYYSTHKHCIWSTKSVANCSSGCTTDRNPDLSIAGDVLTTNNVPSSKAQVLSKTILNSAWELY